MEGFVKQKFALVARILLGLIFFVFGLNGFFHFIPMPPMPEAAGAFMKALSDTGYMIPLLKVTEILAGIIFLSGWYLPLGLVIITPVVYNILLFHIFLAPEGLPVAVVNVILHSFLVYMNWSSLCGLLVCKADMECCGHDHDHEHHHKHD
jgi:putative oxidoreductase